MKISEYVEKYDLQNQFDVLMNSYKLIESAWQNKINVYSLKDKKFTFNCCYRAWRFSNKCRLNAEFFR